MDPRRFGSSPHADSPCLPRPCVYCLSFFSIDSPSPIVIVFRAPRLFPHLHDRPPTIARTPERDRENSLLSVFGGEERIPPVEEPLTRRGPGLFLAGSHLASARRCWPLFS